MIEVLLKWCTHHFQLETLLYVLHPLGVGKGACTRQAPPAAVGRLPQRLDGLPDLSGRLPAGAVRLPGRRGGVP